MKFLLFVDFIESESGQVPAFNFRYFGSMAYIGNWRAIVDLRLLASGASLRQGGRLAWIFWRSAYMSMTMSFRNKVLVPFYWIITWIFGRDISKLPL